MHLSSFNISDLLLSLWRGTLDHDQDDPPSEWPWAVLVGDTWTSHGQLVASATPYLPGHFDRPPRNIADKINSGYKAWEYLLYLYGLAPALLYGILPDPFYSHFCGLVRAMRIVLQHHIKRDDILTAHTLLISFAQNFELLYYQRRTDRLHFVRQSIHALLHLAPEVFRIGPPICSSQWTMERTIGNLGQEIKQPSNPFANLSQRGLLRCQVNALTAMLPEPLAGTTCSVSDRGWQLPRGGIDIGNGYALLRAQDHRLRPMLKAEAAALTAYFNRHHVNVSIPAPDWCPSVARWARLRLPNGQIARSKWKECLKPLDKIRIARNVKVSLSDSFQIRFGEVQYYFRCKIQETTFTLVMISMYSEPNPLLFKQSAGTVLACKYTEDSESTLIVIDFISILSVVGMVPHSFSCLDPKDDWRFVVEKPGLDIARLGGIYDNEEGGDLDM
ncbi:hypothetical protein HYPSUDRAFT_151736 [Hypholoma sublateritium FD-334 SS-4]|uniref:Uncharacterized protein n=1 Tax=Hypholoma sublateritium (strain FD-334 SS-4) TaxID=945553 RepID=A0A0D2NXV2_HYPSF|nr:hypothetical protein HYPSUDRAFT_151736 [Hypholoma sublateritium FD-334 SS-4]